MTHQIYHDHIIEFIQLGLVVGDFLIIFDAFGRHAGGKFAIDELG
jgi:hypothetical protein